MTQQDYGLARWMWHQLEPVHAVFWYAPEVSEEAAGLGYDVTTRWPSYFAWRLAPLGVAPPRLAASACYSFSPDVVAAHVPAAWAVAAPPQILAARERAVDRMYRALFGDLIGSPGLAEAAGLARLMDRRRERPPCPVSRLGRSRPHSGPAYQTHSDPTYLIAARTDDESELWDRSDPRARPHWARMRKWSAVAPKPSRCRLAYDRRTRKSLKEVREAVSDRGGGVRSRGERLPAWGAPEHRR